MKNLPKNSSNSSGEKNTLKSFALSAKSSSQYLQ